jgi:hypothetical protein
MTRYRKRPVEVEARQLTAANATELAIWCGGTVLWSTREVTGLIVPTLEDPLRAHLGDWIIRGIAGEFYPCRDDIFRATYELVEDEGAGHLT